MRASASSHAAGCLGQTALGRLPPFKQHWAAYPPSNLRALQLLPGGAQPIPNPMLLRVALILSLTPTPTTLPPQRTCVLCSSCRICMAFWTQSVASLSACAFRSASIWPSTSISRLRNCRSMAVSSHSTWSLCRSISCSTVSNTWACRSLRIKRHKMMQSVIVYVPGPAAAASAAPGVEHLSLQIPEHRNTNAYGGKCVRDFAEVGVAAACQAIGTLRYYG